MIWALHGNLGSPRDWDEVGRHLPSLAPVDLWTPLPVGFEAWAGRLNGKVRGADPMPVILGYSLGGRLAMHAVLEPDSPWKAAIFACAHPGWPEDSPQRAERLRQDQVWAEKLRTCGLETFVEAWNSQAIFAESPIPPRQLETLAKNRKSIARGFETWSLGRQKNLRSDLARCAIPQLWIAGENDAKFRGFAEETAALIPTAQVCILPDCGHRVLVQKPRELAGAVRDFLRETLGSAATGSG